MLSSTEYGMKSFYISATSFIAVNVLLYFSLTAVLLWAIVTLFLYFLC